MALTWATAVILGGLVSDISTLDFVFVSSLAFLQSLRLFVTEMFAKLISFFRFNEHKDPTRFEFVDKQPQIQSRVSLVGRVLGALFAFICLVGTGYRFCYIPFHPFDSDKQNLTISMYIFYVLVLITSAIALPSYLLDEVNLQSIWRISCLSDTYDNSLAAFYNSVYKTAIDESMTKAEDLQLLEFGFNKIKEELNRNIRPPLVEILNRRMLMFMCSVKGVAMACANMNSADPVKVTAAANLPGLWRGVENVETYQDLFWRLRDRVHGSGDDGIGALNSVTALARHWSEKPENDNDHPFLIKNFVDQANVLDTIVQLLLIKSRSSVVFRVRALEACCRDRRIRVHLYEQSGSRFAPGIRESSARISEEIQNYLMGGNAGETREFGGIILVKLCKKLVDFVHTGRRVRFTSRIYSARALHSLLLHGDNSLNEAFKNWWKEAIGQKFTLQHASNTDHFYREDIEAAEQVMGLLDVANFDWTHFKVMEPAHKGEPCLRKMDRQEVQDLVKGLRSQYAQRPTVRATEPVEEDGSTETVNEGGDIEPPDESGLESLSSSLRTREPADEGGPVISAIEPAHEGGNVEPPDEESTRVLSFAS
ncbi:hypothetical protein KP509_16G021300 [Ceratopteris richardii]|nr:hypothetical protein KP509_16G021300 [Ceratopteris richardii]